MKSLYLSIQILKQIEAAAEVGASVVEIHTGCYVDARNDVEQAHELQRVKQAAEYAGSLSLIVNAGHGLNYQNVKPIAAIKELHELNIGHAIIARALFCGLKDAVKHMRQLMLEARNYAEY